MFDDRYDGTRPTKDEGAIPMAKRAVSYATCEQTFNGQQPVEVEALVLLELCPLTSVFTYHDYASSSIYGN